MKTVTRAGGRGLGTNIIIFCTVVAALIAAAGALYSSVVEVNSTLREDVEALQNPLPTDADRAAVDTIVNQGEAILFANQVGELIPVNRMTEDAAYFEAVVQSVGRVNAAENAEIR